MHKNISTESCTVDLNPVAHKLGLRTNRILFAVEPSLPSSKGRKLDDPRRIWSTRSMVRVATVTQEVPLKIFCLFPFVLLSGTRTLSPEEQNGLGVKEGKEVQHRLCDAGWCGTAQCLLCWCMKYKDFGGMDL